VRFDHPGIRLRLLWRSLASVHRELEQLAGSAVREHRPIPHREAMSRALLLWRWRLLNHRARRALRRKLGPAALVSALLLMGSIGSPRAVGNDSQPVWDMATRTWFGTLVGQFVGLGPNPVYDVRAYLATGNGGTDDTAAVGAAIGAAVAGGGGIVWFGPGTYKISAALALAMLVPSKGVILAGAGQGVSIINQVTGGADVLAYGTTSAEVADFMQVRDLTLNGGRYGINLNNAIAGVFERLTISNNTSSIFTQGQNERHTFRDLSLLSSSGRAIDAKGNLNGGGVGGPLNLPETSKCIFTHVRVFNSGGPYGVDIDAGNLGGQQTTNTLVLDHFQFESNAQGDIRFGAVNNGTIRHVSNEDTFAAANTYTGILIDANAGMVLVDCCLMQGKTDAGTAYQYGLNQTSGVLLISNCSFGVSGPAATADVRLGGLEAVLLHVTVSDAAHVVTAGAAANHTLCINVMDTTGAPLNLVTAATVAAVATLGKIGLGTLQMFKDFRRSVQVPAFGTPLTVDATAGEEVEIVYTSSFTLAAPTNPVLGQILTLRFLHDATAGVYVITWNAVFKRAGGAFANTNAANAQDTISFFYNSSAQWEEIGRAINLS
jgi:Pectate lyase superfamily protein